MIKKILVLVVSLLLVGSVYSSLAIVDVLAQSDTMLAVTRFNSAEQIKQLFDNSTKVLAYYTEPNGEPALYVHLITKDQEQKLKQLSFTPTIIDPNPTISDYELFWHVTSEQGKKLSSFGKIYPISTHYTLVKRDPTKTPGAGILGPNIWPAPFLETVVPPGKSVYDKEYKQVLASPVSLGRVPPNMSLVRTLWVLFGLLAVCVVVAIGYLLYRRSRTSSTSPSLEPLPETQPPMSNQSSEPPQATSEH